MTGGASRWSGMTRDAGVTFALCGFAIAQPLFSLLGDNATFFIAHDISGGRLVAFAFALVLVPPVVLLGALALTLLASPALASVARVVLVGVLIALTLLPPLERALHPSAAVWIVSGIVLAGVAGFAYARSSPVRTFLVYLTPAPVLFVVLFLFVSPAHVLVTSGEPAAAAALRGVQPPIVVVVFDEFPLGSLLDGDGQIDAVRFPGFARLAATSTWYDHATTVALLTHAAVPAIASGQLPVGMPLPLAANYPQTVFTLLARSHYLHAFETLTRLCPEESCHHVESTLPTAELAADLETVYWHTLLGDDLATDWGVAPINDRWAAFGEETTYEPLPTAPADDGLDLDEQVAILLDPNRIGQFDEFLASLGTGESPGMWFIHSLLPHNPYRWLPDGLQYTGDLPGMDADLNWADQPGLVQVAAQRMILQAKAVDQLIDRMLDRLDETPALDDAMVVVAADHGAVFEPNENYRALSGLNDQNKDEVLPVPLFVKYPKQTVGDVDHRDARTFDVLPTLVDVLGADVPKGWSFDGRSLLSTPRSRPHRVVRDAEVVDTIDGPVDAMVMQRRLQDMLGPSGGKHDGFRIGPYGSLVGEIATPRVDGTPTGTAQISNAEAYANVDFALPLPAFFEAQISGAEPGQWLAVALNGTIAGVGPVYRLDGVRAVAMLDPSLLVDGANTVDVYVIETSAKLRPLVVRG